MRNSIKLLSLVLTPALTVQPAWAGKFGGGGGGGFSARGSFTSRSYSPSPSSSYRASPTPSYRYTTPKSYGGTVTGGFKTPTYRTPPAVYKSPMRPAAPLRQSTRNSYYNDDLSARMRSQTRFAGSSYYSEPEYGYLHPLFPNSVLNPVFFWVPWNIWHPHQSLAQTSSGSSATYGAVDMPAIQSNTGDYTRGDMGSAEINGALPEWAQAALRLTHTRATTGLPSDPTIRINGDEAEFQSLSKDFAAQDSAISNLKAQLDAQAQILRAKQDLAMVRQIYDQSTASLAQARKDANEAQTNSSLAQKAKIRASLELEKARASRRFCAWTAGLFSDTACVKDEQAQLDKATQAETDASDRLASADSWVNSMRESASQNEAQFRAFEQMAQRPTLSDAQINALEAQIKTANDIKAKDSERVSKISGFLKTTPGKYSNLKPGCASPVVYREQPGSAGNKHPFFNEPVETELVPDGSLDLVACLNSSGKLDSVYLLGDGDKVSASSEIQRSPTGEIQGILIKDAKGKNVERHAWNKISSDTTRYSLTFKRYVDPDSDDENASDDPEVSIYTDLHPDTTISTDR